MKLSGTLGRALRDTEIDANFVELDDRLKAVEDAVSPALANPHPALSVTGVRLTQAWVLETVGFDGRVLTRATYLEPPWRWRRLLPIFERDAVEAQPGDVFSTDWDAQMREGDAVRTYLVRRYIPALFGNNVLDLVASGAVVELFVQSRSFPRRDHTTGRDRIIYWDGGQQRWRRASDGSLVPTTERLMAGTIALISEPRIVGVSNGQWVYSTYGRTNVYVLATDSFQVMATASWRPTELFGFGNFGLVTGGWQLIGRDTSLPPGWQTFPTRLVTSGAQAIHSTTPRKSASSALAAVEALLAQLEIRANILELDFEDALGPGGWDDA